MVNINIIEKLLNNAIEVGFNTSEGDSDPYSIVLGFVNPAIAIDAYNQLFDFFHNKKSTLIVFDRGQTIDISLASSVSEEIININNLKVKREDFLEFTNSIKNVEKIIFLIGHVPVETNRVVMPNGRNYPVIIDTYVTK